MVHACLHLLELLDDLFAHTDHAQAARLFRIESLRQRHDLVERIDVLQGGHLVLHRLSPAKH